MKILESSVSLASEQSKKHEILEEESLVKWDKPEDAPQRLQQLDRVEFQDFTKIKDMNTNTEITLDVKLQAIIRALESLMGEKMNLSFLNKVDNDRKGSGVGQERELLGWGLEYNYEKIEVSSENLNFSAYGDVKTEDGKNIDFALAFTMQSETKTYEHISLKAGDALIDPLVINFGSEVVSISDVKHQFDLDLDGKSDTFSFVGDGSGFLALDKNADGTINDGRELFGPKSANGFHELRAYDSDNNNWIDENDAVFEQLLIWTKDEAGEENLFKLSDKNVGALYLGSVASSFDLKKDNTLEAQLKESSVYLKEDGSVGTLQEIDLVV